MDDIRVGKLLGALERGKARVGFGPTAPGGDGTDEIDRTDMDEASITNA